MQEALPALEVVLTVLLRGRWEVILYVVRVGQKHFIVEIVMILTMQNP